MRSAQPQGSQLLFWAQIPPVPEGYSTAVCVCVCVHARAHVCISLSLALRLSL